MKSALVCIILIFFISTSHAFADEASPTDDIVVKATDSVIFQMKANLKLTDDQISAVQPIIANNIAKTRNLQQNLQDGTIDSKAMYDQREQLISDENQQLGAVLSPDQMKIWLTVENDSHSSRHSK